MCTYFVVGKIRELGPYCIDKKSRVFAFIWEYEIYRYHLQYGWFHDFLFYVWNDSIHIIIFSILNRDPEFLTFLTFNPQSFGTPHFQRWPNRVGRGTCAWYGYMILSIWWPSQNGPLARYVKLRVAHASGMPGTFSPPPPSNENRGLAIPACIIARAWPLVPWCLSGSLTCGGGENVPGILGIVSLRLGQGWVIAYIVLCAT